MQQNYKHPLQHSKMKEPENQTKVQLKEKKFVQENQMFLNVLPFRSYRQQKVQAQLAEGLPKVTNQKPNLANKIKLNSNQPSGKENARPLKFKYDTQCGQEKPIGKAMQSGKKEPKLQKNQFVKKQFNSILGHTVKSQLGFQIDSSRKREVQSIMFDSKMEGGQPIQDNEAEFLFEGVQINQKELMIFRQKVNKVNSSIEAGLNNIQNMIKQLKKRKQSQTSEMISNSKNAYSQLEYAPLSIKEISLGNPSRTDQPSLTERTIIDEIQQQKQENLVQDSQITLIDDSKANAIHFPPEYTSFVNRLANQIQIDMEFTNMISSLTKNQQLSTVKLLIFNEITKRGNTIDESFFTLQPSEIDPLDNKPSKSKFMSEDRLQEEALRVYRKYKDIESHFLNKLKSKFSSAIIKLLFEELTRFNCTKTSLEDSNSVTVGHLLSYLNMRTNKSFRNRFSVKILKRLQLKPNSLLKVDSLKIFTCE